MCGCYLRLIAAMLRCGHTAKRKWLRWSPSHQMHLNPWCWHLEFFSVWMNILFSQIFPPFLFSLSFLSEIYSLSEDFNSNSTGVCWITERGLWRSRATYLNPSPREFTHFNSIKHNCNGIQRSSLLRRDICYQRLAPVARWNWRCNA